MSGVEALERALRIGEHGGTPAARRPTVVVPLARDPELLGCVAAALGRIADFILIGEEEKIRAEALATGVELGGARFVHECEEGAACARAVALVRSGEAQILMKGLVQTSTFCRAILDRSSGLVPEGSLLSHVTVCGLPGYHKILILTDPAINIDPELEAKARILANAVGVARALGIARPKVACVAPVEKVSAKIRSTVDAEALVSMARESSRPFGDIDIQGPLGLDIAISSEAARTKGVEGSVAGDADLLLLPGLDSANVLYKALTHFGGAVMASVLAGSRVPVALSSRADSERTKLLSLALALRLAGRD